ncbi:DUF3068 domain-containing protein [Corynebacterium sp. SCR221107]|uniref:DUF3068 domain-containing protein n=1 Tax=Corynebacterium sp. SCR221107 TaxID=3017361 RepID=UPI0022EC6DBF|nr:DUF3068 domain-containing protein [Corynebacterium sp. SCR221107]WBT09150.1 DUF3068 domain-containing protein [Corynebacterium sp. SCR221107]
MLPKSRIFSALTVGLGVMLLAWGLLAPYFLHFDGRMPLDLRNTTLTLTDDQAKARIPQQDKVITVPVTRQYHAQFMDPVDTNSVTARIGVTTMRESNQDELDRLIDATVWSYRLDRFTGQALTDATMADQPASAAKQVPIDSLWVKFPSNAEQTTYQVFDPVLRDSAPAVFEEETQMGGRTIYRYHQEIKPTDVAARYSSVFNTIEVSSDADEEAATTANLYHSGTRDYYVDQVSGLIVDIKEQIDDYYGDSSGKKIEQALLFDGQGSQEQTDALVAQAATVPDGHVGRIVSYVILSLGILLTVLGLAGSFGIFKRKRTS